MHKKPSVLRISSSVLLTVLWATGTLAAGAGDDELGEATGLADAPAREEKTAVAADAAAPTWDSARFRGYGLVEHRTQHMSRKGDKTNVSFPNAEFGLAADAFLARESTIQLFLDGRAGYDEEFAAAGATVEQGGIRWRPQDRWVFAVGKERNRRSPGLIVSPSDFLHSSESLPGMRAERGGIWLVRTSWQEIAQSVDVFFLPVDRTNVQGMPQRDAKVSGAAARYFRQFANMDLSLSGGSRDEQTHIGLSLQGLVAKVWKVYEESGYRGERPAAADSLGKPMADAAAAAYRHLFGISYEGSDDFLVRAELFYDGSGSWLLLPGTYHSILSVILPEISDRFNVSATWIKSLQRRHAVSLLRAEWLASARQVVGVSYLRRMDDWQVTGDWAYKF